MVNRFLVQMIIEYGSRAGKSVFNAYSQIVNRKCSLPLSLNCDTNFVNRGKSEGTGGKWQQFANFQRDEAADGGDGTRPHDPRRSLPNPQYRRLRRADGTCRPSDSDGGRSSILLNNAFFCKSNLGVL